MQPFIPRGKLTMSKGGTPHFSNDAGASKVEIGVKEFKCIGARPPFDHPHIFLDMGSDTEIICPYCSTLYVYNAQLGREESRPPRLCVSEQLDEA